MAKKPDYDLDGWKEAKDIAADLMSKAGDYSEIRKEVDDAYFMDYTSTSTAPDVKSTISPDPHNKIQGAARLLTATAPHWDVPFQRNDMDTAQVASRIEQMAAAIWSRSNSIQGRKVERELALMAFLYDEMQAQLVSTKDMLDHAKAAGGSAKSPVKKAYWDGQAKAAEEIANRTPFLIVPILPSVGAWRRNLTGLEAHYTEVATTVGAVLSEFGDRAAAILSDKKQHQPVTLCSFYDRSSRYVWVKENTERPIIAEPHGLPFIPVAVNVPEGSQLFDKTERNRMPFLYSVIKSGIWERQCMLLTATMSNAAALLNAQFVFEQGKEGQELDVNLAPIAGTIVVPPGGHFGGLAKQVVNPEVLQLLEMANGLMDASTIYNQTLGEPLGGNAPYSLVSLLAQVGRLPMTSVQEGLAAICKDLMGMAFTWLKQQGGAKVSTQQTQTIELKADEIPAGIDFDCRVDVDLPQDKLQAANTAVAITQGDRPLASQEWARKNILNIGQSDQEQQQIWREQMSTIAAQVVFQQFLQQTLAGQGQGQPNPAGGPGPQGGPMPGQPGQPGQPGNPPMPANLRRPPAQGQPVNPNGPVQPEGLPQVMAGPNPQVMPPGMNGGQ